MSFYAKSKKFKFLVFFKLSQILGCYIQTLLSYCYEFRGAEVFSHRMRYPTIHPNDPETGGVRVVPFN